MVEVFKTTVRHRDEADMLIGRIHAAFPHYSATFDLEDCDRILRVKSTEGPIHPSPLIALLRKFGFDAEVLPDDMPVAEIAWNI